MRSDWAHRVKEVEEAASRSDERARLAEEHVRIMTIQFRWQKCHKLMLCAVQVSCTCTIAPRRKPMAVCFKQKLT